MAHSFVQIPPDSSGKKMLSKYNVDDDSYTQGVVLVSPSDPNNIQEVDAQGQAFVRFVNGSPEFDSFGRLITATNRPLFDVSFNTGILNPNHFYLNNTAGATIALDPTLNGAVLFTTNTASGTKSILSTHKYFKYTPGFETSYVWTMALGDEGKSNVVRRAGAFDDDNGLYFEVDSAGLNVVIRSSITGTERRVAQGDFNGDKLDGTGLTTLTKDLSKDNIFWITYQWLGAGAVKFGMFANGTKITLHTFSNFNNASTSYMFRGNLPFRIEQENTGIAPSSSELRFFCLSVSTTAPQSTLANSRFKKVDASVTADTSAPVHLISFRPTQFDVLGNPNREALLFVASEMSVYMDQTGGPDNGLVKATILIDATVTGGTWNTFDIDTEINTTGTITNGFPVYSKLMRADGEVYGVTQLSTEPGGITRKANNTDTSVLTVILERIRGTQEFNVNAVFHISAET